MNPIAAIAKTVGAAYGKRQDRIAQESKFKAETREAEHRLGLKRLEAETNRSISLDNNDAIADAEAQRAQKGSFKDEYMFILGTFPGTMYLVGALYSIYCAALGIPETIDFKSYGRGMIEGVFGDLAWMYPILYAAMMVRLLGLARAFRMVITLIRGRSRPSPKENPNKESGT